MMRFTLEVETEADRLRDCASDAEREDNRGRRRNETLMALLPVLLPYLERWLGAAMQPMPEPPVGPVKQPMPEPPVGPVKQRSGVLDAILGGALGSIFMDIGRRAAQKQPEGDVNPGDGHYNSDVTADMFEVGEDLVVRARMAPMLANIEGELNPDGTAKTVVDGYKRVDCPELVGRVRHIIAPRFEGDAGWVILDVGYAHWKCHPSDVRTILVP